MRLRLHTGNDIAKVFSEIYLTRNLFPFLMWLCTLEFRFPRLFFA